MAPSAAFIAEMERARGSRPLTKIEHISKAAVVTDISEYFLEGANLETVKERAPDEIQAGEFDVVLSNQDDKFSEYISGSLFFETDYHGSTIRISQGFVLPDGSTEYEVQGTGYIDQLITDRKESKVTLRCRDRLWRVMDQTIHPSPPLEVAAPGVGNVGNGVVSVIDKLPFTTANETWTITCTTGGADGVAQFSVVGSVSGSIGPATSGTEFVNNTAGIKFTINAGSTVWVIGDVFTFTLYQHPEWDTVNVGKIIWSVLTGYNWDTDTQENWSGLVFDFDHTKSSANTDLDYDAFNTAITDIASIGFFDIKGFARRDTNAVDFLQQLLTLVLGSLFTGNDGRIKLKTYIPTFGVVARAFADELKITELSYNRSIDEVINSVTANFILTENWPYSDGSVVLDGRYSQDDSASIAKYQKLAVNFDIEWFHASGQHVTDFADKLIQKYSEPPLNVEFKTGMDALTTEIGDRCVVRDAKTGIDVVGEVAIVSKLFDSKPTEIMMMLRRDAEVDQVFGYIGSSEDEGDGLSPQDDDYDTASTQDKSFAYFGSTATSTPDYRYF